jgi:single-strand DNA-binding protein
MYNDANFTVTGNVGAEPDYALVGNGVPRLRVRVCWNTRRQDPETGEWADANTSWINVTCWRNLAKNLKFCLHKGDPVVLRGRLEVRPFTGKDGQQRISVDVEADFLSHDTRRGVADFQKVLNTPAKTAADEPGAEAAPAGDPALAAVPGGTGGADDIFDNSAIEALAQETDSVTAPF